MSQDNQVRFIRVRGRIVPVRPKKTEAQSNSIARSRVQAQRSSQGSSIGLFAGAAAGFKIATGAKIRSRLLTKNKTLRIAGGEKSTFKVVTKMRVPTLTYNKQDLAIGVVAGVYGAGIGNILGAIGGHLAGKIEGDVRYPRFKKPKAGRK